MTTSWQKVSSWYQGSVGEKGNYFHQHVIIPGTLRLLNLNATSSVLDLACGQGVLARHLPPQVKYSGIDAAHSLIDAAKKLSKKTQHTYTVGDVSQPLSYLTTINGKFTHCTCILALQNIENFQGVFDNAAKILTTHGRFIIVINHPYFRIPRQSSWGFDDHSKLQYRRINRYLSPLKIPITTHPGKAASDITWSFHQPLSAYIAGLKEAGFAITDIDEWVSDKESVGTAAKMENFAREEFPLFMAISATKTTKEH